MSSWERGYGDLVMAPDFATLRRVPWQPGTALLLADVQWLDGTPVVESPRQILQAPARPAGRARLAGDGRHRARVHRLRRQLRGGVGQALLRPDARPTSTTSTTRSSAPAGSSRCCARSGSGCATPGMQVESAKGECNLGQHEIAFKYADALTTCDNHVIYKNGAKEIAAQHGSALTFMAKYNEREGNSCHIHLSLRTPDGRAGLRRRPASTGCRRCSSTSWPGSWPGMRELSYFFAPNINSYKRYQAGSFAPTAVMWGLDNRTCSLRVVGHGPSLRFENRVPGGDVNPYLAVAAMIAAGLHGIDNELPLDPAFGGNAYAADAPRVPTSLRAGGARCSRAARSPARRSATRSSTTTPTRPERRGRGLRRCGDRLGTHSQLRADVRAEHCCDNDDVRRHQPGDRAGRDDGRRCTTPPRPTPRSPGRARLSSRGGRSARATGRGCCGASPRRSTPIARTWRSSRSPTPATRSATPAGRPATSAT